MAVALWLWRELSSFPSMGILSSGDEHLWLLHIPGQEQMPSQFALMYSNKHSSHLLQGEEKKLSAFPNRTYSAVGMSLSGASSVPGENNVSPILALML